MRPGHRGNRVSAPFTQPGDRRSHSGRALSTRACDGADRRRSNATHLPARRDRAQGVALGDFGYDAKRIQIGRRWADTRVRVVPIGKLIHGYYGTTLIRSLALDPDRRYQGSGKQERR